MQVSGLWKRKRGGGREKKEEQGKRREGKGRDLDLDRQLFRDGWMDIPIKQLLGSDKIRDPTREQSRWRDEIWTEVCSWGPLLFRGGLCGCRAREGSVLPTALSVRLATIPSWAIHIPQVASVDRHLDVFPRANGVLAGRSAPAKRTPA